jgi:hypothetical protein
MISEEVLPINKLNTPIPKKMQEIFSRSRKRFLQIVLKQNAKLFNSNYFTKWQLSNSKTLKFASMKRS